MKTFVLFRTSLLAAVFCAALSASATVLDFNTLTGGTTNSNGYVSYPTPLVTGGYTFASPTASVSDAFGTWTAASDANTAFSNYTGSTSPFSNYGTAVTMTSAGGAFSVGSVDVANIFRNSTNLGSVVTFSGALLGGGSISQTYALPNDRFLHTVALSGFGNLSSLTLSSLAPGSIANDFQFDNVNVNPTPEPATMAALGLGAVAMLRRRKRA